MEEFQELFPGLYQISKDMDTIYLNEKTELGNLFLKRYMKSNNYLGFRTRERVADDALLELNLNPDYILTGVMDCKQGGFLTMGKDFHLSDDACVFLYSYNIDIRYCDQDGDIILYDRDVIMRRWTINNIINE